jgi:hypothetical protein
LVGFFPVDSYQLLVLSSRNRAESIGKNPKISGQNTDSTKSPELPGTGRFRAGLFDLGDNNENFRRAKSSKAFAITTSSTTTTNCCFTYFNS